MAARRAEEDELLDAEEAAEEQARLEQAQLAEQERDASNEKKKRARATNRKDMKKLTEEIDMARVSTRARLPSKIRPAEI